MDKIDRNILLELQKNARLTVSDLSEKVALSQSPCARRLKNLEDEHYITGYRAVIDREKVGLTVTVFVGVKIGTHQEKSVNNFESLICSLPEVLSCHVVSGQYDYLMEVVSDSIESHERFLRKLISMADIKEAQSCFAMRKIKVDTAIPI